MTIIVGVADGEGVCMAADTGNTYSGEKIYGAVKIRRIAAVDGTGEVLVAAAGNGAALSLLQAGMRIEQVPARPGDQGWADGFAHQATRVLAEATPPVLHVPDGDGEQVISATLLLGVAGELWYVFTNQASLAVLGYAAIGTGSAAAMGALMVSVGAGMEPSVCIGNGIRAACLVSPFCTVGDGGPLVEVLSARRG